MIKAYSIPSLFVLAVLSIVFDSCAVDHITKSKNIIYNAEHQLKLDVYAPEKKSGTKAVLVFIHGGSWKSGEKSTYNFFGKGMAKHNVVTVIIDYRPSRLTTYEGMANDAAEAIKWIKQNISSYEGDTNKIFVSGHSAADNNYFKTLKIKNPIKGVILIDGFGLDMYGYLKESKLPYDNVFTPAFTTNPEIWKKASPIFYLQKETPPFLIFLGGKTNLSIINDNRKFLDSLLKFQPNTKTIIVKRRRHVGMIFQFINRFNKGYKEIIDFMKTP